MRAQFLILAILALAVCGSGLSGCTKAKAPAPPDPHSAEGVMLRLQEQGQLLDAALARKDFTYIHDYSYYFTGLLQALHAKLDDGERQRLRGVFDELAALSAQLDHAGGRRHFEATEATVLRLQAAPISAMTTLCATPWR